MTVKELQAELARMNQDAEVTFLCPDGYEDWVCQVAYYDGKVMLGGPPIIRCKTCLSVKQTGVICPDCGM